VYLCACSFLISADQKESEKPAYWLVLVISGAVDMSTMTVLIS